MTYLRLQLFGSYRLTLDGQPIDALLSDKGRALLAYLAVENDRPHPRKKLVGIFWGEYDEEHARGSLSQALYHLRGVLGDRPLSGVLPIESLAKTKEPYLLVTPQDARLNPSCDCETDVATFSSLVEACKAHHHTPYMLCEDCLHRYQEAARRYAGDFLDGFYLPKSLGFEEWATVLREQLRLEMMEVLERLTVVFERRGELEQALRYARKMVHLDELSEMGNQQVMRLLALMDRRGEAITRYASFQHALAVQMGAESGAETKALCQMLRNEEAGTNHWNLPASLTPLIGRRQELDELWGFLRDPKSRLICVSGPGGCGKTRLALEAAHRQRYNFRDGICFVSLSALGTSSSILAAIAEGLGFTFRDFVDPKKQLLDYLQHKKVLLILDSFETVVERAGLVAEILSASKGSKALVTSRARLNLSGEQVYPLEGMKVPPPDAQGAMLEYSSVELFLDAACRVNPGYTPDSLKGVARICRLVEGMPLSLLLASTWVSDHSTQEIGEQISRSLDFLSVEWADLPERQRSLRATFEYSWKMLSNHDQQVLMSLSVFCNPFATQAAHDVAAASSQVLRALVGKSLLGLTDEGQYQMHNLVRQYSDDKLAHAPGGQEGIVRQKHSDYFLRQVDEWTTPFKGQHQAVTLIEADKKIDDVMAAWEWAAQHADMECLSRALEGLILYFSLRYRYQEGEHACQVALEGIKNAPASGEHLNLEGWLLVCQASFSRLLGKVELARQVLDVGKKMLSEAEKAGLDTRKGQAQFWWLSESFANNLNEQLNCNLRSASLYQALGDAWRQAGVMSWAGEIANRLGDRALALSLHQQAVELGRLAGEPRRLAGALMNYAYDHLIHWTWKTGAEMMKEAASLFQSAGDPGSQASADLHLGVSFGWTGHMSEAIEMVEMAVAKMHHLGDRFNIAYGTLALGLIQMYSGKYERAMQTLLEGLQAARQDGFRREEAHGLAQIGCLALVRGEPEQALVNLEQSIVSLRQMGFAGELGIAFGGLALSQHRLGQDSQAWAALWEALRIAVETHSRFTLFTLPAALIVLLADTGRWQQALEAYSAVMTDPMVANSRWFADMVGNRMNLAREHLTAEVVQAAETRGREGDLFDALGRLAEEISTEFEVPARHT